jgi:hypothetical protein
MDFKAGEVRHFSGVRLEASERALTEAQSPMIGKKRGFDM